MNAKQFADELHTINTETMDKVRELVQRAQAEEGLNWDTDQPVSFHDDPNWQNYADGLAETSGWIYDRLNGRNRLHKKSVTKKIRKALGYTYP